MSPNALAAIRAYGQTASMPKPADQASGGVDHGFGAMVERAIAGTVDQGRAAEASATQVMSGQGNIVDLVTAVAETEVAVEALVSVRDRVISSYQSIMNMPI